MAKMSGARRRTAEAANGAGVAAVDRAFAILAAFRPGCRSLEER